MNATNTRKFSEAQTKVWRELIQFFKADGLKDAEFENANRILQILNVSRDKDWFKVSKMAEIKEELGLVKGDSARFAEVLAKLDGEPKTEEPKTEKPKAEKSGLDQEILDELLAEIAKGSWDRKMASAWLGYAKKLFGAAAKGYLDEAFKTEAKTRGTGPAADFYGKLETGPMDDKTFAEWLIDPRWIKDGKNNVNANKTHYDGIRRMANAIWAKNVG